MTRRSVHVLVATLGLVGSAAVARAADAALPEPKKITSVEGITEYELANGLRVLLFPDASKPTVTVNITYFVGSRHEGYGESGMAHLLEHMVFKGTPDHPEIWKALQEHGAQFNGTTSFDRTNYFETLNATDENLEFALKMEADRMVNSFIAKKDLESEFSVVRNEFESGENNPIRVLGERIMSTAFLWHNYGKDTIGSKEDIERVPIENLQAFYKKYYQPDNAMLVVAGKFDPDKTLRRINELFGRIPRPERKLQPTYTVEPAQDGEREVVLRRVGDVQAIGCVYHICAGAHPDMAALDVLAHILTADQTGRLYKALIEPQLATSVNCDAESLHDPGVLSVMAEVRIDKPLDPVLCETLDNLGRQEFTEEEVERAKNSYAKRFDLLMKDSGRVGIRLTESAAMGDWRLLFLHRDRVAQVTPSDVRRVAQTYLKPSNRTIGMFIPDRQPDRTVVPTTPEIASMLKNYRGREAVAEGADQARRAAVRHEDGLPAAADPRQQGHRLARPPLRQRGRLKGPNRGGRLHRTDADGRHVQA
jgi:zinc protease